MNLLMKEEFVINVENIVKMGTYGLNGEEIADIFEKLEFEMNCEGDFSEKDFIAGAREYLKRLREEGAFIPK